MVDAVRFPLATLPVQRLRAASPPVQPAAPAPIRAPLSQLVGMAQELAQQGPPVDHARIAQLRAAIADGSYPVDVRSIASAMVGRGKAG